MDAWGQHGTQGGPWASFVQRYQRPLALYARRRLGVDAELADELAARFVARELGREHDGQRPLFRLYDPNQGRFRSLLATAFWRFARDELAKEGRRRGVSLDAHPALGEVEADDEFCQLVAREFFEVVRARLSEGAESEDERAVLALKWPGGLEAEPLDNAGVERQLGLSRQRVRTCVNKIGERFVRELRRLAEQAGLAPGELQPFVGDTCRALDRSTRD